MRSLLLVAATLLMSLSLRAQTVVDIIVNSPNHTILETAVIEAGLVDALNGAGPFTVFAPDDAAFGALPAGVLDTLLANPSDLADILLYHVVGAEIMSGDIATGQQYVNSLLQDLSIQVVNDNGITLNQSATVNAADLDATNGVVHSISAVILPQTIADIVNNSVVHNTLEVAVGAAGYANALANPAASLTLFAPSDGAFNALPAGALDSIVADAAALDETILYHILTFAAPSSIVDGVFFQGTANNGYVMQIQGDGQGTVAINNNPVVAADINAVNGVVHVLDQVLAPPTLADFVGISALHETLEIAVGAASPAVGDALSDRANQFTLFAPSDAQFAALPAGALDDLVANQAALSEVLLYHVLPDTLFVDEFADGLSFNRSAAGPSLQFIGTADSVTVDNGRFGGDLLTTNGIIHIPGNVLFPPNVVDIAVRSPVHSTLVTAVIEADLAGALSDETASLTVFAPTDDAFAGLPAGTLDDLLADPGGFLTSILTYHVLGQEVSASDIVNNNITMATTLQGEDVEIAVSNGMVTLNGSVNVTIADIYGTNGIVHAIDGVLIPDAISSVDAQPAAQAGILVGPIPATSFTDVQLPASITEEVTLSILDVRGAQVGQQVLGGATSRVELGQLAAGTYFFLLDTGTQQYQQMVVKR